VGLFGRRAERTEHAAGPGTPSAKAGAALVALLLGELPLDLWPAADTPAQGEPWDSFRAARAELAAGHRDQAVGLWLDIAARTDIEARHVLQAWTFLRQVGESPGAEHAKDVLGVVVSVPVQRGHDVLAAYRDGSARYGNFSGAAVVVDDAPAPVSAAQRELLEQGRALVSRIGPWTEPQLPSLPEGDARLVVLTPSGPHFGQAPFSALSSDLMARPVLDAAFHLLNAMLSVAAETPPADSR
jgi:hypothetical protein